MPTNLINASITTPGRTTSRTFGARFSEVIDVRDWGAQANGSDDAPAIQAAIDYAWANAPIRTIFLPAGIYSCYRPIFIDDPASMRSIGRRAAWNSATTYNAGDVIVFDGLPYQSMINGNINNEPYFIRSWKYTRGYSTGEIVQWEMYGTFNLPRDFGAPGTQFWQSLRDISPQEIGPPGWNVPEISWTQVTPPWLLFIDNNPITFNMAFSFVGEQGLWAGNPYGAQLIFLHNYTVALCVGPGNGNMVSCVGVGFTGNSWGDSSASYRVGQPTGGVGIGICDGAGGASRTIIENCGVNNFYNGIRTGFNVGLTLGDSSTIDKTFVNNAGLAYSFPDTQNFINTIYDSNADAATSVWAAVGTDVHIHGGNFSGNENCRTAALAVSSVSGLSQGGAPGSEYLGFSATVDTVNEYFEHEIINSFAIVTSNFGVIPCELVSWDYTTRIGVFKLLDSWLYTYFTTALFSSPGRQPQTFSKIDDDIQAITTIYGSERIVHFKGNAMTAWGTHIEWAVGNICLVESVQFFGNEQPNSFHNIHINYETNFEQFSPEFSVVPALNAAWFTQNSWPYIYVKNIDLYMDNMSLMATWMNIDFNGSGNLQLQRIKRLADGLNLRVASANPQAEPTSEYVAAVYGKGLYDKNLFGSLDVPAQATKGSLSYPFVGFTPARWAVPPIIKADLDTISSAVLPALNQTTVPYPWMWGMRPYQVVETPDNVTNTFPGGIIAWSGHKYYTYGQNISTTNVAGCGWHYKGQSNCLYLDANTMQLMTPGLGIILDNGSDGEKLYMVRTVHPGSGFGYVTVWNPEYTGATGLGMAGSSATVYTGSTIIQQPFSIITYGDTPTVAYRGPAETIGTAIVWYGVRGYSSTSIGKKAIKLRRDSDNATQDFYIQSNGELDFSAISTFKGAGNLFVDTWYDQGNVGVHAVQSAVAQQPGFTLNALGEQPALTFDPTSTAQFLLARGFASTGEAQPNSFSIVALRNASDTAQHDTAFVTANQGDYCALSSTGTVVISAGTELLATSVATGVFHSITGIFNGNSSIVNINGTDATTGAAGSNSFQEPLGMFIGRFLNTDSNFNGQISEIGLWHGKSSMWQRTGLFTNQDTFYIIP